MPARRRKTCRRSHASARSSSRSSRRSTARKDALDGTLRAALEHQPELVLEGCRYTLGVAMYKDYPLEPTLAAFGVLGATREEALSFLGGIDGAALKKVMAECRKGLPATKMAELEQAVDANALVSPVTRLTVRQVRAELKEQGGDR